MRGFLIAPDWPDIELLELLDALDVEVLANIDPMEPLELVAPLGGDIGLHGGAEPMLEPEVDAELVEDGLYRDRDEELVVRGEVADVDAEESVAADWPVEGWPLVAVEPASEVEEGGESAPSGGGPELPGCAPPIPLEAEAWPGCDPALLVVDSFTPGVFATLRYAPKPGSDWDEVDPLVVADWELPPGLDSFPGAPPAVPPSAVFRRGELPGLPDVGFEGSGPIPGGSPELPVDEVDPDMGPPPVDVGVPAPS